MVTKCIGFSIHFFFLKSGVVFCSIEKKEKTGYDYVGPEINKLHRGWA